MSKLILSLSLITACVDTRPPPNWPVVPEHAYTSPYDTTYGATYEETCATLCSYVSCGSTQLQRCSYYNADIVTAPTKELWEAMWVKCFKAIDYTDKLNWDCEELLP